MALNSQIGALRVHLGLNSAQFSQGLKQAQTRMQRFQARMKSTFKAIAIGATAAFAGATAALLRFTSKADETIKTARALGLTAEQLSRLRLAARRGGVEIKTLNTSLRTFNTNISDAAAGLSSRGAQAFERLGIKVRNLDGSLKTSRDLLAEVADEFQDMPDGVEKSARAMELFGSRGAAMINILNGGREGLAAMDQEADKLGQTLNTRTAKAAERFNDNLDRIREALGGVWRRLMDKVLPVLADLSDDIAAAASEGNWMRAIVDDVSNAFKFLVRTGRAAVHIVRAMGEALKQSNQAGRDLANLDFTALVANWRKSTKKIETHLSNALSRPLKKAAVEVKEFGENASKQLQTAIEGFSISTASTPKTRELPQDVRELKGELGEADQEGKRLVDTLTSGLSNALSGAITGTKDWKRQLLDLAINVIGGTLKRHLQSVLNLGGGGGGGGFLGGLAGPIASLGALFGGGGGFGGATALANGVPAASSLGLFGFRTGGAFTVPGHGGPDSETAAFRVSPGENVTIDKNGGGGGPSHITVDVRGANGDRAIEERVQAGVAAGLREYDDRLPGRLQDIDRRLF